MKYKPEEIDKWLRAIEYEGKGLSVWEEDFVESIKKLWEKKRFLSDKQEEILERIYAEKTP